MRPPFRRYSLPAMLREARRLHAGWGPAWPKASLRRRYAVAIVGGGPTALALADALARHHGRDAVAVLAEGALAGPADAAAAVVPVAGAGPDETAMLARAGRLYPALSQEMNFNLRWSRRGVLDLAFDEAALDAFERSAAAARALGAAAWLVPPREARLLAPLLAADADLPAPPTGALWQPQAGTVDGDAVVWAYARMAAAHGVEIVENLAVTALDIRGGRVAGLQVGDATVAAETVVLTSAAAPALLAGAGLAAPLATRGRLVLTGEPMRPRFERVLRADRLGGALRQSPGGALLFDAPAPPGTDRWAAAADAAARLVRLCPRLAGTRLVRADVTEETATADGRPLLGPLGPAGPWLAAGWGANETAAAPLAGLLLADSIAHERPHPLMAPFVPAPPAALGAVS